MRYFKILILTLVMFFGAYSSVMAEPVEMIFSCYCPESCPGTITASGEHVREGILACSKDHMGDCAMIYTLEGEFLGFYECLDTGGNKSLRAGKAVDVWMPNLTKAKEMMARTRGKVLVEWIEKPKG